VPRRVLVEWLGFQAVWFASAIGAARGTALPGVLSGAFFVTIILFTAPSVRRTGVMILSSGAIGALGESFLAIAGFVTPAAASPALIAAPAWLVALWLAFGATIGSLRPLLGTRPLLAAAGLGLVAGPLAYWAGAGIGALAVGPSPQAWPAIAALWAAVLPTLIALHGRLAD
jgi:hypothetical protein